MSDPFDSYGDGVFHTGNNVKDWKRTFEDHTAAVQEFLNELYAIMVDPLAEGAISVEDMKVALLAVAIRDRDKSTATRKNPYERDGKWYWFDETEGESVEAYDTEVEALIDLTAYSHYLTTGVDVREHTVARWQGEMAITPSVPLCTRCVASGKPDPQPATICKEHFDIIEAGYEKAQGELDRLRAGTIKT